MRSSARRGYTLLEVLIASAIAVLLLSALYFAFDLTLRTTDTGRALVSESDLNRAVINRMTLDLSSPLGVLPPMSGGGTDAAGGATTSADAPATDPGATPAATTDPAATPAATPATTSTVADPLLSFQGGLIGTSEQMILFVSRVPKWLSDRETAADPNALLPSDAHRVSYYMHSSGKGLCRQQLEWITADKVGNALEIDRENEDAEVIAPEVVALVFEYASGTGYVSEWDGTQGSLDGDTVTGPPRAVRASITFEYVDGDGKTARKKIVHVFPIRSAVGLFVPETPPEPTTAPAGGM